MLTLLAATLAKSVAAQEADPKETPLGHATLLVTSAADTAEFEKLLREFCAAEHLKLLRNSRIVNGRLVLDFSTSAVEKTFFSATNDPAPGSFDIYVYSRAPRESWEPFWNRLIQHIRQGVGANRIFVSRW
ncbi:MAG TPA: hypothetical protein VGI65_12430 [Steroidobacteraceae bacterium]